MRTLGEVLQLAISFLKERQVERARRLAEELLAFVLKLRRLDLYMQFDRPLEETELNTYRTLLKRKSQGEPLEYLLKEIAFADCTIAVDSRVLIPRQETEILFYKILEELKEEQFLQKEAWDLCCGSGCLGVALKKKIPSLNVTLSDISADALAVARQNALRNNVDVAIRQGDLLLPFKGRRADFIICNPPYISVKEYLVLDREVRNFEPHLALVGGDTGLEFYERLAFELPSHLNSGAKIFFEIGCSQKSPLLNIFSAPIWKKKVIERDWAGHDRFFFLEIE
ncbi:MAG: peptide chain release factor N(5)-glutamine methyltransferase [Anaerolineae bacterium]